VTIRTVSRELTTLLALCNWKAFLQIGQKVAA